MLYFEKKERYICEKEIVLLYSRSEITDRTGKKIKAIRSDQGLEYCAKAFEDKLRKDGIKVQRTNTYTPEQNGVAERLNRTVMESARCTLIQGDLPKAFWAEAVNTAVYLRNRCSHKTLGDHTPFELWTGRKPSVRHLKAIGCLAYVHIPRQKRSKLDARAKQGILVGYARRTKGYRIYLPDEKTVKESIHVRFDETKRGKDRELLAGDHVVDQEFDEEDESIAEVPDDEEAPGQVRQEMADWKRTAKTRTKGQSAVAST